MCNESNFSVPQQTPWSSFKCFSSFTIMNYPADFKFCVLIYRYECFLHTLLLHSNYLLKWFDSRSNDELDGL